MQVGASGLAGHTNGSDHLPLASPISDRDIIDTHMCINGLSAISVTDNYISSITTIVPTLTRHNHFAIGRSKHWSINRSGQVNTIVAVDTLTLLTPTYRSQIVTGICRITARF